MDHSENIITVAVPAPLYQCYDYLLPADCPHSIIKTGMRLRVPFGRSTKIALVVDSAARSKLAQHRLKRARALLDSEPLLPPDILSLLRWAAEYYHHPLGEVIFSALPALLREGRPPKGQIRHRYRLTPAGKTLEPGQLRRAPRQAALLALLRQHPEGLEQSWLQAQGGDWRGALHALESKGLLNKEEIAEHHAHCEDPIGDYHPHSLHPPQEAAINTVCQALGRFQPFLLEGVTGSGKTEVYLHIIEQAVRKGLQALVLIPEIGLTPQLVERFRQHLRLPLAVLHSGLTDRQRLHAWLAARNGEVPVVIGTRSAVFTPMQRPGVIIVDEEHDPSFKQQDGFRYHARDVAVMRARRSTIPVVLGSATPSLESLHNAATGRYVHLRLERRAGGATPPRMVLIDIRNQRLNHGLSPPLLKAIGEHLREDHQVLLFLNRRGYAPTLYCQDCGWVARCQRCDAHLVLHQSRGLLRCHHCDSRQKLEHQCPQCGGQDLHALGQGTERVEEALQQHFPDTEIIRVDRDSTRRKGSLQTLLSRLHDGGSRILLGTQMIAKGHHLPDITLVGVLDADQGLFGADFRATERMAQLVLQVAGRAGRARLAGEVLIQSRCPEHPLFAHLLRHDYPAIGRLLLEERQHSQLPPFSALALLRAEAVAQAAPLTFLEAVAQQASSLCPRQVQLLGPVPAPMERRAGRYRAHLLLQSRHRGPLHQLLTTLVPRLGQLPQARKVRWSLDVDPQEMF